MPSTNKTPNYNLPIFIGTDKPAWLTDWNGAMTAIDTNLANANQTASTADNKAITAQTTAETADATANTALKNANTAQTTADTASSISGQNAEDIQKILNNLQFKIATAIPNTSVVGGFGYRIVYNQNTIFMSIIAMLVASPTSTYTYQSNGVTRYLHTLFTTPDNIYQLPVVTTPTGSNSFNIGYITAIKTTASDSAKPDYYTISAFWNGAVTSVSLDTNITGTTLVENVNRLWGNFSNGLTGQIIPTLLLHG